MVGNAPFQSYLKPIFLPYFDDGAGGGIEPTGQTAFFMDGGDSNTAFGQNPGGTPDSTNSRVKEFKQSLNSGAGGIQTAQDPQEHFPGYAPNIGHAVTFGKLYKNLTGHDVCIVPIGRGGSGFAGAAGFDWRSDTDLFLQSLNRWKAAWGLIGTPKFAAGIIFSINTNNVGTPDANTESDRLITRFRTQLAGWGMSPTTPAVFIQVNPAWLDNPTFGAVSRAYLPNGTFSSPGRWAIHETIRDIPNTLPYSAVVPGDGFTFNAPTDYTHHSGETHKNVIAPALVTKFQEAALNVTPPGFKSKPLLYLAPTLTYLNGAFTVAVTAAAWHNPQPSSKGFRIWKSDEPDMTGKVLAQSYTGAANSFTHTPATGDGMYYQGEVWGINVNGEHNYFTGTILQNLAPGFPPVGSLNFGTNLQGLEGGKVDGNGDALPLPGAEGFQYFTPDPAVVTEMSGKGFNVFRIPFLAERIQPTILGALDSAYAGYIQTLVTQISALTPTRYSVLDLHNYNKRRTNNATASDTVYGTAGMPITNLTDLWSKIANVYKTNDKVLFDLMNEPEDQRTPAQLISDYNQVIAAIRATGSKNRTIIPIPYYCNAHSALVNGLKEFITGIVDPYSKPLFSLHQYFDTSENGGGSDTTFQDTIHYVFMRLQHAVELCRTYGAYIFLGEVGLAAFPDMVVLSKELMKFLRENRDVIQFTCSWASGKSPAPNDAYTYKMNARDAFPGEERPQTTAVKTLLAADNFPYAGASIDWRSDGRIHGAASLSAIASFTRASPAWDFVNSQKNGETFLKEFLNNVPRISEYGLRLEDSSSNIWQSDLFYDAPGYTELNLQIQQSGGNTQFFASPDNNNKAARLLEGTANGIHEIEFGSVTTPNPNTPHAFSYWFKAEPNVELFPWISGSKGDSSLANATIAINSGVKTYRKGNWARNETVLSASNASAKFRIGLSADDLGGTSLEPEAYLGLGRSLDLWNMQIEPNRPYAGTPIPKYGAAAVSRAAEALTPISSFLTFLQGNFTLLIEVADLPAFGVKLPIFQLNGIDAIQLPSTHRARCEFGTAVETGVFDAVSAPGAGSGGSRFRRHPCKFALTIHRGDSKIGIGALGAGVAEITSTPSAVANAKFGNHGGVLKKFCIIPSYKTSAELTALLEDY